MIGYLEGRVLKREENRILLLVNQVGYEVLLPEIVEKDLGDAVAGDDISLYIYHQQTERQPKPVLIGFNLEIEKEFFEYFITVEDIGALKAVKALNVPIREIARAIEDRDIGKLKQLKGVGNRTAQKIVATLEGKMDKFALIRVDETRARTSAPDVETQVFNVLVSQLGYKTAEAKQLISEAFRRNSTISTPEELFEEVYRGESIT